LTRTITSIARLSPMAKKAYSTYLLKIVGPSPFCKFSLSGGVA
jgi:hypothetical protein